MAVQTQTRPHPRIKYGAGSNPPLEGEGTEIIISPGRGGSEGHGPPLGGEEIYIYQ